MRGRGLLSSLSLSVGGCVFGQQTISNVRCEDKSLTLKSLNSKSVILVKDSRRAYFMAPWCRMKLQVDTVWFLLGYLSRSIREDSRDHPARAEYLGARRAYVQNSRERAIGWPQRPSQSENSRS
jgi:hypothetical protein